MDRSEYTRLLSEASINDNSTFSKVNSSRPPTRERPVKHYHPLLEKEKQLKKTVHRIFPDQIASQLYQKSSRLAHLNGLPKTHKPKLSMRPILSAAGTYNYTLAKWLDEKLKPLSSNIHTISDVFSFADELQDLEIHDSDILVSYDVTSLFTNIPLNETITIVVDKAFESNWFNTTYNLNITKQDLEELLKLATTNQLFIFNG